LSSGRCANAGWININSDKINAIPVRMNLLLTQFNAKCEDTVCSLEQE